MGPQNPFHREDAKPTALGHLRVLDLAGLEAQYCAKLLADLGADVIKVEPPEGDSTRYMAPFARDIRDPEGSLYFINYNTNKRSLTLDLTSRDGRNLLGRLVATADVLVESFMPGHLDHLGLGFKRLSRINPGLVMVSITPFGQSGPYKGFLGSDLTAQAMGGLMYLQGDDAKPPCILPCDQSLQLASLHAVYGALAALHHRNETGRGQQVDVSMQEVMAHLLFPVPTYAYTGTILRRPGAASAIAPGNYYLCKDGYIYLYVYLPHHWQELVSWMDNEALAEPVWQDLAFRRANSDVVDQFVAEFVSKFTVAEFVKEGQRHHIAVGPLNTVGDMVNSDQMRDRKYFTNSKHPHIGEHAYPGPPYRFSQTPWRVFRPAPLLGQHQQEVLEELAGTPPAKEGKTGISQKRTKSDPPLKGVRIVDFSRVWAGPLATRYLADLGAEVIRIETSQYVEPGRVPQYSGPPWFPEVNRSKLGVSVDFHHPQGLELVKRMVEVSDVVVENFAAGVMDRRGLGYESLKKVKPDIIMISMPGYGNTGPYADYVAFGQTLMASGGLSLLWGHPDSPYETRPKIAYPDCISAATAATAIMTALEYRSQTGQGQFVEIAQAESLASTMGVAILDYLVNGRSWQPMGNRNLNAAPNGCYPCRGDDQWCVISCKDEEQWNGLCRVMETPSWAGDPIFGSLESRYQHHDELDERISQWTREYTPYQVMRLIQRAGVPAGVVQSGEQLYQDHHLRSRNFIVEVEHAEWGRLEHTGIMVGLSRSPGRIVRGLAKIGWHNHHVFSELLGTSPKEMSQLIENKAIG